MNPVCPPGYICRFVPVEKPYHYAHWWDTQWGIFVAVIALFALVLIVYTIAYYVHEHRKTVMQNISRRDELRQQRAHDLAIEEQRTMQLDAAKGNPEMLKIVRQVYK